MVKSVAFMFGFIVLALAMNGCGEDGTSTSTGSTGSTGTGGGGGDGGGPSIPYPACLTTSNAVFVGKLDGMTFDKAVPISGQSLEHFNVPQTATVHFYPDGELDLVWTGKYDNFTRFPMTGTLLFPGESTKRAVKAGSTIVFPGTGPLRFLMDLVLENGELFVCSHL